MSSDKPLVDRLYERWTEDSENPDLAHERRAAQREPTDHDEALFMNALESRRRHSMDFSRFPVHHGTSVRAPVGVAIVESRRPRPLSRAELKAMIVASQQRELAQRPSAAVERADRAFKAVLGLFPKGMLPRRLDTEVVGDALERIDQAAKQGRSTLYLCAQFVLTLLYCALWMWYFVLRSLKGKSLPR